MSVMIWDSTSQAFVEAQTPMVYDTENQAWRETTGLVWDEQNQAWVEKWNNEPKPLIPIMTSDTCDVCTVDTTHPVINDNSGTHYHYAYYAFDEATDNNVELVNLWTTTYADNINTYHLGISFNKPYTITKMYYRASVFTNRGNNGIATRVIGIYTSEDGTNYSLKTTAPISGWRLSGNVSYLDGAEYEFPEPFEAQYLRFKWQSGSEAISSYPSITYFSATTLQLYGY